MNQKVLELLKKEFPLLSHEKERELFTKLSSLKDSLTLEDNKTVDDIKEIRDLLIYSNVFLVIRIAHLYKDITKSMELEDLISEGFLGLITAVDKFDVNKNIAFSTYAYGWIKGEIKRNINNYDRGIRRPVHLFEKGVDIKDFSLFEDMDEVHQSENEPIYDFEEKYYEKLKSERLCGFLADCIEELPEKEKTVLSLRILNKEKKTQQEIAKLLNTTKQNVSLIEEKAKKHIKKIIISKVADVGGMDSLLEDLC
ncbi:MAG: sigma-70 family RNA polymerase sigma factor [Clostridiales Family XIII bacterium]|nr:sigma-70 family RNA polymerase sigma factor [Clostridiales Family XIII bacterium]